MFWTYDRYCLNLMFQSYVFLKHQYFHCDKTINLMQEKTPLNVSFLFAAACLPVFVFTMDLVLIAVGVQFCSEWN